MVLKKSIRVIFRRSIAVPLELHLCAPIQAQRGFDSRLVKEKILQVLPVRKANIIAAVPVFKRVVHPDKIFSLIRIYSNGVRGGFFCAQSFLGGYFSPT